MTPREKALEAASLEALKIIQSFSIRCPEPIAPDWVPVFDRIRAALAMPTGSLLLPIDSAPRDGTKVDLWTKYGERITDAQWSTGKNAWMCWGNAGFGTMDLVKIKDVCTHWMPLPEPPKEPDQ